MNSRAVIKQVSSCGEVADSTPVAYLANFITHQWELRTPDVLISVVGSAQDFTLSTHLQSIFSVGLSSAATTSNAWIFTGGTDTGVMKLVGAAMQEKEARTVPLIGIGPWGAINGRERLVDARGDRVNYWGGAASAEGAALNSAHSHFLLVEYAPRRSNQRPPLCVHPGKRVTVLIALAAVRTARVQATSERGAPRSTFALLWKTTCLRRRGYHWCSSSYPEGLAR